MSRPTYRIRDWERHFETSESRKRKGPLAWVGIPCKHSGRGFNRLKRQQDWPAIYGCWSLIVQIAAMCPTRGTLADQDGAFTALDIADKVGLPQELVQRCLDLLTSQQAGIEWLQIAADTPATPADSGRSQQTPADSIPTEQYSTEHNNTKKQAVSRKPRFEYYTWMTSDDLPDPLKVLAWHSRVVKVKNSPVQDTDGSRINTLAAAAMAVERGNEPIRWFVWCVKDDKFKSITQAAEDAASKTLKAIRRTKGSAAAMFAKLAESTIPETVPPDDEPSDEWQGGDE